MVGTLVAPILNRVVREFRAKAHRRRGWNRFPASTVAGFEMSFW